MHMRCYARACVCVYTRVHIHMKEISRKCLIFPGSSPLIKSWKKSLLEVLECVCLTIMMSPPGGGRGRGYTRIERRRRRFLCIDGQFVLIARINGWAYLFSFRPWFANVISTDALVAILVLFGVYLYLYRNASVWFFKNFESSFIEGKRDSCFEFLSELFNGD